MIELGVNIDHVATLRQARRTYEPDPGLGRGRGAPGRRRRHHRAPARGPAAHPGRGRAPPARAGPHQAQSRDGGDGRDARHRVQAASPRWRCWCPKGGTRSRPKAASTSRDRRRSSQAAVARLADAGIVTSRLHRRACRRRSRPRRASARRCAKSTPVRMRTRSTPRAAIRRAVPSSPSWRRSAPPAKPCSTTACASTPGHALNYFNVQPVAALPGVRELHIGHAIVLARGVRRLARSRAADEGADPRSGRDASDGNPARERVAARARSGGPRASRVLRSRTPTARACCIRSSAA